VIVRMCTGRCRQILSIVVPMIFDEYSSPIRGNEVRFCLLNFPSSSMKGKIRRQRNPLFSSIHFNFTEYFQLLCSQYSPMSYYITIVPPQLVSLNCLFNYDLFVLLFRCYRLLTTTPSSLTSPMVNLPRG
jgi:hypothetical protein